MSLGSQTLVVTLGAGVLMLALGWRIFGMFKPGSRWMDHPAAFFLAVFAAILAVRLPQVVCPRAVNMDEAQFLAQAMRFCAHPVPWRDVDGTTSGPLNSMLLSVPMLFGGPPGWPLARLTLWAANCLTLGFLYLGLRAFGSRAEAQFVLIPTILFYAFALGSDFTHYSSETLPVVLLSAGFYMLSREWTASRSSKTRLFTLGLVAGSIPFTKLQAAPLALFLVGAGLAVIVRGCRSKGVPMKSCWQEAGALCLGTAVVPGLILGWVAAEGALSDFWISYILASGSYAEETSMWARLDGLWMLFPGGNDFRPYFVCAVLALSGWLGTWYAGKMRPSVRFLLPLLVVLADGFLTVLCLAVSGKAYPHYTLLLVPPLAYFTGLAFFAAKDSLVARAESGAEVRAQSARWLLVASVLVVAPMSWRPIEYLRGFKPAFPAEPVPQIAAVTSRIIAASRSSDTLAIWGWMPAYYVETRLMPATRDAIGHYVVTEGPYRDFFRHRFLGDLERSKPAVFVDAVAEGAFRWWKWQRADAHENDPELAAYIDDNYSLWWTIHLVKEGLPVRIYVLKSRMVELNLTPGNVETVVVSNPAARATGN